MLKNMPRVGAAGRELRSFFSQLAQEPLSAIVDKRDFIEVHNTRAFRVRAVVHLPACAELVYPWAGEAAVQNPFLFGGGLTEVDFQHAIFLGACLWRSQLRLCYGSHFCF